MLQGPRWNYVFLRDLSSVGGTLRTLRDRNLSYSSWTGLLRSLRLAERAYRLARRICTGQRRVAFTGESFRGQDPGVPVCSHVIVRSQRTRREYFWRKTNHSVLKKTVAAPRRGTLSRSSALESAKRRERRSRADWKQFRCLPWGAWRMDSSQKS